MKKWYIHVKPENIAQGKDAICVHDESGEEPFLCNQLNLPPNSSVRITQTVDPEPLGDACIPHIWVEATIRQCL